MSEKTILVWFRNDLRVHDNEILFEATRKADKVLPVYIFDPFYFKTTELGLLKTGNIRAKFLLESIADLRSNLQKLGGELSQKKENQTGMRDVNADFFSREVKTAYLRCHQVD